MARIEVLEQRASVEQDERCQQANKEDLYGC